MKRCTIYVILFALISCTVNIPDIKITGEKTALENQVMGEYAKISEDAWMIASERSADGIRITADRRDVVEAVRDREFYRDDVNELKIMGILGELRNGLLDIVDTGRLERLDDTAKKNALMVIEKENRSRTLIMQRIIETDVKFNSQPDVVYESFFNMNLADSPPRTFYKNHRGDWTRK